MAKIYLLSNKKFDDVVNIEVFKIKFLEPSKEFNIQKYDALLLTSKNSVYALNNFVEGWKTIPCFAIAPITAEVISKHGGNVEYVAHCSGGDEFAQEIKEKLLDKKVLYVRATRVVSNLVSILQSNGVEVEELIAYETVCNDTLDSIDFDDNSVVIFTSPSSIECFFKKYSWKESLHAVVIGNTTAKYLPSHIKYTISSQTSMEECVKLARELIF